MKRLWRLVKRWRLKRRTLAPLEVETPRYWSIQDVRAFNDFLRSATGERLRAWLFYMIYTEALIGVERSPFEQGIVTGKNRLLSAVLGFAEPESVVGDDDDE